MKTGTENLNKFNEARQECARNANDCCYEVYVLVLALIKKLNQFVEENKNDDSAITNAIDVIKHANKLICDDSKTPQTYENARDAIGDIADLMSKIGEEVQQEKQKRSKNQRRLNEVAAEQREYVADWEQVTQTSLTYSSKKETLLTLSSAVISAEVNAIIQQLDEMVNQALRQKSLHPHDALKKVGTAIEALNDTSNLLSNNTTPDEYKEKAQKYKAIGFKVLGALMLALCAVMLTAGTGLTVTGIGTVAGAGLLAGGGAMGLGGLRFFKIGKENDALRQNMLDLAGKSGGIKCS